MRTTCGELECTITNTCLSRQRIWRLPLVTDSWKSPVSGSRRVSWPHSSWLCDLLALLHRLASSGRWPELSTPCCVYKMWILFVNIDIFLSIKIEFSRHYEQAVWYWVMQWFNGLSLNYHWMWFWFWKRIFMDWIKFLQLLIRKTVFKKICTCLGNRNVESSDIAMNCSAV